MLNWIVWNRTVHMHYMNRFSNSTSPFNPSQTINYGVCFRCDTSIFFFLLLFFPSLVILSPFFSLCFSSHFLALSAEFFRSLFSKFFQSLFSKIFSLSPRSFSLCPHLFLCLLFLLLSLSPCRFSFLTFSLSFFKCLHINASTRTQTNAPTLIWTHHYYHQQPQPYHTPFQLFNLSLHQPDHQPIHQQLVACFYFLVQKCGSQYLRKKK